MMGRLSLSNHAEKDNTGGLVQERGPIAVGLHRGFGLSTQPRDGNRSPALRAPPAAWAGALGVRRGSSPPHTAAV